MRARFVVAVVDDDHRMLESMADLLEAAGHDVRLYSSARMLWENGPMAEIDCVISDIGMPGMDGFELLRLSTEAWPELPVFLITGRPEVRAQASMLRPDRYFEKPFDVDKLLAAIAASLPPSPRKRAT